MRPQLQTKRRRFTVCRIKSFFQPFDHITWKYLVLVTFILGVSLSREGHAQGLTLLVNSTGNESDDDVVNNRFPDKRCDVDPNTTGDQCTLRAAIETHDAYRAEAGNTILFNIPLAAGTSTALIKVENTPLFFLRGQVHLDGTSQPGYAGKPIIELDGSTANGDGLQARGTGSIIEGLIVHSFSGWGIRMEGTGGEAANHIIRKNFIGTDPTGTIDKGNGSGGVLIIASPATRNNTIEENVISGNGGPGVEITGEQADHNTIDKNKIGLNQPGDAAIPNDGAGVLIHNGAPDNTVGREGNIISGNAGDGVLIDGPGANNNRVQNNKIGTNAGGDQALGNTNGVQIAFGAQSNQIGRAEDLSQGNTGNLLSGNRQNGVLLTDASTSNNRVWGNTIGTNLAGEAALPNEKNGVAVSNGAQSNDIGLLAGLGNLISGNKENGVLITGAGTNKNRLHNNAVGTNRARNATLPNHLNGVAITLGARENEVGGLTGDGNLISGNEQNGVLISGTGTQNTHVRNNAIGVNGVENAALGNGTGIEISGGAQINIIGLKGVEGTQGNLISGNRENGVLITGTETIGNSLHGNLIGSNRAGNTALANGANGVTITAGAEGNDVGGPFAEQSNLISGNTENGVLITGNVRGNRVSGNKIGTNLAGNAPLPNNRDGVLVSGAAVETRIGGFIPEMSNLISGNGQNGVLITGEGTVETEVEHNKIGTDVAGEVALPNGANGVAITGGAKTSHIGSVTEEGNDILIQANLIRFNKENGVLISGTGTIGNQVQGNTIRSNDAHGVAITSGAQNNFIGETSGLLSEGNTISSNKQNGIWISGAGTNDNFVAGNYIGTDDTGGDARPNGAHGVAITLGAKSNQIGRIAFVPEVEEDLGQGNVISGNEQNGVLISGAGTENNVVQKNFIGTDYLGGTPVPNNGHGVAMELGAKSNTIGLNNLVSGNKQNGVLITGAGTDDNAVLGNKIGTNAAGTAALGNSAHGVAITGGAKLNRVGGTLIIGQGNHISGNGQPGVFVTGDASDGNRVEGNMIGGFLDPSPNQANQKVVFAASTAQVITQAAVISDQIGILITDADAVIISKNTLTAHSKAVVLTGSATGIPLSGNLMFNNSGPAIDLGDDGVTANDAGDADTGPNNLQNFPVLTAASSSGGNTTIRGALNSLPNTSFRLEFFANTACDASGFGEGETFLGFHQVTTNGTGHVSFTANLTGVTVPDGAFITATATDAGNNTSEFSACLLAGTVSAAADLELTKQADKTNINVGDQLTFTVKITNKGPDAATQVAVKDVAPAGLTFHQITPSLGSYDVSTGLWTVAALNSGVEATLTITATATQAGTLVNTAEVMASDQPDPDSAPGNGISGEDDQSSISVTVQDPPVSADQLIRQLMDQVSGLVEAGKLTGKDAKNLTKELENALKQVKKKNAPAAIQKLEAFVKEVKRLVDKGKLAKAEGQELISAAQKIIDQLRKPPFRTANKEITGLRNDHDKDLAGIMYLGNYPNPFSASTTISFALVKQSKVKLVVYDQSGSILTYLLDEVVPAGLHTIVWRPGKLPAGIYFLQLQGGNSTRTRRIVYAK